jgi:hypothetical protein
MISAPSCTYNFVQNFLQEHCSKLRIPQFVSNLLVSEAFDRVELSSAGGWHCSENNSHY